MSKDARLWSTIMLKYQDQDHTSQEIPWRINLSIGFSVDIEDNSVQHRPDQKNQNRNKNLDLDLTIPR